jgi:hypothetical protein
VYAVDWKRKYDLLDKRPQLHVRFLNLQNDADLIGFMRAWGPLWQTDSFKPNVAEITVPRAPYWRFHRKIKAELKLAQNARFDDAEGLRAAILEYVAATDAEGESATAISLSAVCTLNPDWHPKEWIPHALLPVLRRAATNCLSGRFSLRLRAAWEHKRLHYSWELADPWNLAGQIELGLWNSLMGVKPVSICEECQTVFQPDSAHPRKFCSYRCAHRVAVRMSRKNSTKGETIMKRGKHAKAKKA